MADYERWYMAQHLPERVGATGFRFGRRYVRMEGDRRYFTFYELDRPEVLWSDEYLERLGNPTDWTQQVMPNFRNTIRTAACRLAVFGRSRNGWPCGDNTLYGRTAGLARDRSWI